MKIGVISDSHGHIENLRRAIRALKEMGAEVICHLGDDYDDMEAVRDILEGVEVVQVPGVFSPLYRESSVPNRVIKVWGGKRFLLSHTKERHENDLPQDPDPQQVLARGDADALLFGHTHIPQVERSQGILLLNTGHLKDEDKKGYPPTFALVEVQKGEIEAKVFDLYSLKELLSG